MHCSYPSRLLLESILSGRFPVIESNSPIAAKAGSSCDGSSRACSSPEIPFSMKILSMLTMSSRPLLSFFPARLNAALLFLISLCILLRVSLATSLMRSPSSSSRVSPECSTDSTASLVNAPVPRRTPVWLDISRLEMLLPTFTFLVPPTRPDIRFCRDANLLGVNGTPSFRMMSKLSPVLKIS